MKGVLFCFLTNDTSLFILIKYISFSQRAKEIYFKAWDPQRDTLPDGRFGF